MRLLRAAVFRRRVLTGSPPALDRRLIASPRLRTEHYSTDISTLVTAQTLWSTGSLNSKVPIGNIERGHVLLTPRAQLASRFRYGELQNRLVWSAAPQRHSPVPYVSFRHRHRR